jgi:excisionase family DNA binding protein
VSGRLVTLRERAPIPRLALRPEEAAEALGVSRSFFYDSILPDLPVVRIGRVRMVPVAELERWLDSQASRAGE